MLGNVHGKKITKCTGTLVPSIPVQEKDIYVIIVLIFIALKNISSLFKPGQKCVHILRTKLKIQKNGRR